MALRAPAAKPQLRSNDLVEQFQSCTQASQSQFQRQTDRNTEVFSGLSIGAGVILVGSWIYALTDANPVSLEERRQLARDYDQKLATHLGVPVSEEEAPKVRPDAVRLTLQPQVSSRGGGLTLAATF